MLHLPQTDSVTLFNVDFGVRVEAAQSYCSSLWQVSEGDEWDHPIDKVVIDLK